MSIFVLLLESSEGLYVVDRSLLGWQECPKGHKA